MSLSSALVPDERLLIQTCFFVASLVSLNYFIVSPLSRLHNERKKRTSGAQDLAKEELAKSSSLQSDIDHRWKSSLDEARKARENELSIGQSESDQILARAKSESKALLDSNLEKAIAEITTEKTKIPQILPPLIDSAWTKISGLTLLLCYLLTNVNIAHAEEHSEHVEFWSGIFWPYFQFACFAAALVYFARAPLSKFLDNQRTDFRSKLSEAKEALTAAEQKTKELTAKIAQFQAEVEKLKSESTLAARLERQKMVTDAKANADFMMREAERSVRSAVATKVNVMRQEIIEQVMAALDSKLTESKLVELDGALSNVTLNKIQQLQ
jgi:F0F1-type ATP synthase membrane subunit b/b'